MKKKEKYLSPTCDDIEMKVETKVLVDSIENPSATGENLVWW